ncbi:pachytene checkpoint protein 2 homolog [Microplitis demolitor]|uniref:pachytene checkpoint protein 2 homolog n=1 Tax=Microplitis demolitor TaxID=69319 RepID=UPI0004CCF264|nr:pachytene checkpoint protein 2 homolog [Microplitis demolitor]
MISILDVEVCQKNDSTLSVSEIEDIVKEELNKLDSIEVDFVILVENWSNEIIKNHVVSIICSCTGKKLETVNKHDYSSMRFYIYRLTEEEAATETMQNDTEELAVSSHWILPCKDFHGLWENLCYDSDVKENLLKYVETTMMFADRNVNHNIITWNKVVLLHGPPGTGKTSLCKALAQKAAIRLNQRFSRGELVEINSHSLFSKWFSESGKLVMKLFTEIKVLLDDPESLVCILIDEVESLAHARKACINGTEPSDSIRVVNSLLTQLDQIKRYKNVLIMTTSNVTEAIDLAFVDRADIKQFIGHPGEDAIAMIYYTCLKELERTGLLKDDGSQDRSVDVEPYLKSDLVPTSVGLSGRTLRKIPFLAHALHLSGIDQCTTSVFLHAMMKAVKNCKTEILDMSDNEHSLDSHLKKNNAWGSI